MEIILTILCIAVSLGVYCLKRLSDSIKSYSNSYGSESGKIDAATKKLDELELQISRTTQVAESIKSEITDKLGFKQVLRDRLEELFEQINMPTEIFVMSLSSENDNGMLTIEAESIAKVEKSILRSKTLTGLYFSSVAKEVNEYIISVRVLVNKCKSKSSPIETEDIKNIISGSNEIMTKLMKISKELAA